MVSSRRKEPPPSAQAFNRTRDIADGTCNSITGASKFDRRSVVSGLVEYLASGLDQLVAYDQGIGTSSAEPIRLLELERLLAEEAGPDWPLAVPPFKTLPPAARGLIRQWRGILFGYGLRENVLEIFAWLAAAHADDDDRIFLFGFSRGAFTARALAGLLQRCGLPTARQGQNPDHLARCWALYSSAASREQQDTACFRRQVDEFRQTTGQRSVSVHFLGLWDTVKSYGTIRPVLLPLLRHNPAVCTVRHALALDECKGWFDATTWGGLDSDRREGGPFSRPATSDVHRIGRQSVEEVWFQGGHSSIGSGEQDGDLPTSNPALTWMLAEGVLCGLRVNDRGHERLRLHRTSGELRPVPYKRDYLPLGALDVLPRATIDNGGLWPTRSCLGLRGSAPRDPAKSARSGQVMVHDTVTRMDLAANPRFVTWVQTRSHDAVAVLEGEPLSQ